MRIPLFFRHTAALCCGLIASVPLSAEDYRVTIRTQDCSRQQVLEATHDMPVTLVADPQTGATFLGWSNGATDNPYTLTVTSDTTLMPLFSAVAPTALHRLTLYADACDAPTTIDVAQGNTVTLVAQPKVGYLFSRWEDGDTTNPRTVTATADATYRALFIADPNPSEGSTTPQPTHTITIQSDKCATPKTLQATEGQQITLYASADDCGTFLRWADGNTDNPRTVEVTGDATYTAEFTRQQYTLTAVSDNNEHGSVSVATE